MLRRFPIGISDFKELIEKDYYFVDKSLLIKQILDDGAKVVFIPRPRRFGKTLNLSMAHYFFNCATTESNAHLFQDLAIRHHPDCMAQQGAVPSIFLTLKGVKALDFEEAYQAIAEKMSALYQHYVPLLDDTQLAEKEKKDIEAICQNTASSTVLQNSLKLLTRLLHAKYHQKVMIFLDEYDVPMQAAYLNHDYEKMVNFIQTFMGEAFKDNIYLERAVITGIMRVAQTSIFSDLNNIQTYTLLHRDYGEYFGFTQDEVDVMLRDTDLVEHSAEIKNWYNGYQIKELKLYNPWSIIHCLAQKGELRPYWVSTSDNILIKRLISKHRYMMQPMLEELMQYHVVTRPIDEGIVFPRLEQDMQTFWSLLLFSGYLTVSDYVVGDDGLFYCQVSVPNKEIMTLYVRMVREWFAEKLDTSRYDAFIHHLLEGNIPAFQADLQDYIRASGSYFDFNLHTPEAVYHAFILGLIVGLRDNYIIQSNREAGEGRCDVALIPKDPARHKAMVLEFKRTEHENALTKIAKLALKQISKNDYAALFAQHSVKTVTAIGIGFAGKKVQIIQTQLI
jgi:hypothetical protein